MNVNGVNGLKAFKIFAALRREAQLPSNAYMRTYYVNYAMSAPSSRCRIYCGRLACARASKITVSRPLITRKWRGGWAKIVCRSSFSEAHTLVIQRQSTPYKINHFLTPQYHNYKVHHNKPAGALTERKCGRRAGCVALTHALTNPSLAAARRRLLPDRCRCREHKHK